jgi:ABC-2 type transport system permease protein
MYPFSTVLSNYIIFLISLIVLFGALIVFRVVPTIYLIQSVVPLFLILILAIGSGMMLATLAVFFRDLEYLWSVVLMIIMYTSAIFYHMDSLHVSDSSVWVFKLNPLYVIIDTFRSAVFGTPMNQMSLVLSVIYSFGSLIIGILLFYRKQDNFILNI